MMQQFFLLFLCGQIGICDDFLIDPRLITIAKSHRGAVAMVTECS